MSEPAAIEGGAEPEGGGEQQIDIGQNAQTIGGDEQDAGEQRQPSRRQQKRDVFNENRRLKEENERLTREAAERAAASVADRLGDRFERAVDRIAPAKPSPTDEAFQELQAAAKALNAEDPASLRRFADAQTKMALAGIDVEQLVRDHVQRAMPQQRPPEVQRLHAEFPWAMDHEEDIAYHAKRLARDGRNMRDSRVLMATLREAAIRVAQEEEIQVGPTRDASAGERFAATPGRNGRATTSDGTGGIDRETRERIQQAADSIYSDIPDAKGRFARWMKDNGHHLQRR